MVSKIRAQRISDRIFEELSTLLILEVSDPRLGSVSVTHVSVDRELAYANIFVSSIEGSEAAPEILDGLKHAAGFLRRQLAHRIQLRSFPQLRFYWDQIPERADYIDKLIDSLPETDPHSSIDEEDTHLDG
jgi:ribosome-binding factor A